MNVIDSTSSAMGHKTMKKLIEIILTLALVFGCAADSVTYRQSTNYNYLDFGSYQLGIDKSFEFIGDIDAKGTVDTVEGVIQGRLKTDTYVFADACQGKKNIRRAVGVRVYTLRDTTYWRGEANFDHYKSAAFSIGNLLLDILLSPVRADSCINSNSYH
jgi:hypothetical protein